MKTEAIANVVQHIFHFCQLLTSDAFQHVRHNFILLDVENAGILATTEHLQRFHERTFAREI
jgi:hypothetical protein